MASHDPRPLIMHVVYRFDVGGLENGVVNLLNGLPADRFRHAVVAMTEVSDFRRRVQRDDVEFFALNKPPGQGLRVAPRLYELARRLRPAIVHTRNLAALEMALPAALARVPVRIHGEHGWDASDPEGHSRRFRLVRRVYKPLIHRYVALSRHLARYLSDAVGVDPGRVEQIYNGVDTRRFAPPAGARTPIAGSPFGAADLWLVGTVGRLQAVKNQGLLARAFVRALELDPEARRWLRLVIAGDGPLRPEVRQVLDSAGVAPLAWMAGERSDIPEFMRGLDAFVLPSLAEGISNTVLEAMATALPVAATAVGGTVELLEEGTTGRLLRSGDVDAMARAMLDDRRNPDAARRRGQAARAAVQQNFSLDSMLSSYGRLYERLLDRAQARGALQRA